MSLQGLVKHLNIPLSSDEFGKFHSDALLNNIQPIKNSGYYPGIQIAGNFIQVLYPNWGNEDLNAYQESCWNHLTSFLSESDQDIILLANKIEDYRSTTQNIFQTYFKENTFLIKEGMMFSPLVQTMICNETAKFKAGSRVYISSLDHSSCIVAGRSKNRTYETETISLLDTISYKPVVLCNEHVIDLLVNQEIDKKLFEVFWPL